MRWAINRKSQYAASFSAMIISVCSGLHFGWSSPYVPLLLSRNSTVPMNEEESSWIAYVYIMGCPCGALATGLILDAIGRKTALLASSIPFIVSWLLIACARTLSQLLTARFIAGFSEGCIFGATPIYLTEIIDKEVRGFVCSFVTISVLFGVVIINILGTFLSVQSSALVGVFFPLTFISIFMWMPESPNYFLMKNKREDARKSLMILRETSDVEKELEEMIKSVEEERSVKFSYLLKAKVQRKSLLMIMGLRGGQQLSGVVAFIFYAQTLFEEISDIVSPLVFVIILYGVQIFCSIASSVFVDKWGRRPLLIVSLCVVGVILFTEGGFFFLRDYEIVDTIDMEWIPIGGMIVVVMAFGIGMQAIPLFIAGEIFPTKIRAYASALSDVCYFLFAFVASKCFQLTRYYGLYLPFLIFGFCTIIGLIVTISFVPETKNKTLKEIQVGLKNS
ncbi:hypothetical protein FQA39_LY07914 [Lamprigera yunnana]|nr:hypothetical protein FQA39_LY07914 [Lamprigera yunnana]